MERIAIQYHIRTVALCLQAASDLGYSFDIWHAFLSFKKKHFSYVSVVLLGHVKPPSLL